MYAVMLHARGQSGGPAQVKGRTFYVPLRGCAHDACFEATMAIPLKPTIRASQCRCLSHQRAPSRVVLFAREGIHPVHRCCVPVARGKKGGGARSTGRRRRGREAGKAGKKGKRVGRGGGKASAAEGEGRRSAPANAIHFGQRMDVREGCACSLGSGMEKTGPDVP